jgi:hypothetical protein
LPHVQARCRIDACRSRDTAARILNICNTWSGQLHTLIVLSPNKEAPSPIFWGVEWTSEPAWKRR